MIVEETFRKDLFKYLLYIRTFLSVVTPCLFNFIANNDTKIILE